MPNVWKAIVRSTTTWLTGTLVGVALHLGYHLHPATASIIAGAVGLLLTVLLHFLEVKWVWIGALLGWVGAPKYTPVVTKNQVIATLQADLAAAIAAQSPATSSPAVVLPPAPPLASPLVASTSSAT